MKGWRGKKGDREKEVGVQGLLLLPSLSPVFHDFLATSRSGVALHRASSSFNEEFGLLLVSPLVRPHRFYAIRRRSRVLLHPRSRTFLTIHRANPPRHRATVERGRVDSPPRLSRNGAEMEYYIRCNVN